MSFLMFFKVFGLSWLALDPPHGVSKTDLAPHGASKGVSKTDLAPRGASKGVSRTA